MLLRLLLLLTIVPVVELILLLQVHHAVADRWGGGIGLLATIGTIIVTGVAGASLARHQGIGVFRRVRRSMQRGELPGEALLDGVLVLLGAALLLTPGFLTDALGLSLLIPPTRILYRKAMLRWLQRKIERGEIRVHATGFARPSGAPPAQSDDVLEVDFTPRD